MKLRKFITRRRLKWAGLGATLAMALVFTASFRLESVIAESVVYRSQERIKTSLGMQWGFLYFSHRTEDAEEHQIFIEWLTGERPDKLENSRRFLVFADDGISLRNALSLSPRVPLVQSAKGRFTLLLPTWIPLVLLALVTMWLWWVGRPAKLWQCQQCRYDLRGLEEGGKAVCPECGTPVESDE